MEAVISVASTCVLHLPLLLASRRFNRCFFPAECRAQEWLQIFFVACVIWRLETLLLHACGAVHWPAVVGAHVLICAACRIATSRTVTAPPGAATPAPQSGGPTTFVAAGWIVLLAALALHRVVFLPDPYDALTYHLMLPVHWLQTGSLQLLATPFGDASPGYTPEAVEGFFLALMLPSGHDSLARVGQLPLVLAAAYLVFDLTRRERRESPTWVAAVAASAFLLLPDLLTQGTNSMADVGAAAFFLGACQQLTRYRDEGSAARAVLGGALAGLFVASRFPALLAFPLLVAPWVVTLRRNKRHAALFLASTLATGAFPYLRNWMLTGNPVYPLAVDFVAGLGFPGLFTRDAMTQSIFHLEGQKLLDYYLYYLRAGLGWCAAGVIAPLLLYRRPTTLGYALGGAVLLCLQLFVMPFNANGRFIFPAWAWLVIAAASALGASRGGRVILAIGCGALACDTLWVFPLWAMSRGHTLSLVAAGVFLLGLNTAWLLARLSPRARVTSWATAATLWLVALGVAGVKREARLDRIWARDHRYAPFRDGWRTVRMDLPALLAADGSARPLRIAYTGLNLPYPLTGSALANHVTTVPLDGGPSGQLPHEQRLRLPDYDLNRHTVVLALDRMRPNRAAWRQALTRDAIDVLAVYVQPGHDVPIEYRWATADPASFEPIDTGAAEGQLLLFRVREP
ncbi:MAG: hypothetical protein AB7O52_04640 [Planctomycetota bacterium]